MSGMDIDTATVVKDDKHQQMNIHRRDDGITDLNDDRLKKDEHGHAVVGSKNQPLLSDEEIHKLKSEGGKKGGHNRSIARETIDDNQEENDNSNNQSERKNDENDQNKQGNQQNTGRNEDVETVVKGGQHIKVHEKPVREDVEDDSQLKKDEHGHVVLGTKGQSLLFDEEIHKRKSEGGKKGGHISRRSKSREREE